MEWKHKSALCSKNRTNIIKKKIKKKLASASRRNWPETQLSLLEANEFCWMDKLQALQKVKHVVLHHWQRYFYFFNTSRPYHLCSNSIQACRSRQHTIHNNNFLLYDNLHVLKHQSFRGKQNEACAQMEVSYFFAYAGARFITFLALRPLYASLREVASSQYLEYFASQTFASMPTARSRHIKCERLSSLLCHLMAEFNPR